MNTRSSFGSCDMKHFARFGYDPDGAFSPRQDALGFAEGTSLRLYFVTRSSSVQFLEVTSFSAEEVPLCSASSSICQTGLRLSQRWASSLTYLTLVVLKDYAADTKTIAKASASQLEDAPIPFLVVVQKPRTPDFQGGWFIENPRIRACHQCDVDRSCVLRVIRDTATPGNPDVHCVRLLGVYVVSNAVRAVSHDLRIVILHVVDRSWCECWIGRITLPA
jgi:hypothetical protein